MEASSPRKSDDESTNGIDDDNSMESMEISDIPKLLDSPDLLLDSESDVPSYPSKVKHLSRLTLNMDKAGMDTCDRESIDRAIYEASKVS